MKAIQRYGEGFMSSEYENYANRLAAMAGIGQSATGSTAAAGAPGNTGHHECLYERGECAGVSISEHRERKSAISLAISLGLICTAGVWHPGYGVEHGIL